MDTHDMNQRQRSGARNIGEQAAEWLLVLEDGGAQERAAFSDWIAQSPLHVEAFLRAATMDSLLGRVDADRTIGIEKGGGNGAMPNVVALEAQENKVHPKPASKTRTGWKVSAALAACLAIAFAGAWFFRTHSLSDLRTTHYITAVGEQRVFELDDGSVLHMNTGSRVDVLFSGGERRIELLEGEAMFRVHRDPLRPFRVYSDDSVVQALGTQFNVNLTREGSVVSVLEGAVQVSATTAATPTPIRLMGGEQIRISRGGAVAAPTRTDVSRVSAWRQRRLIFVDEPLESIAGEFNRYNRTPKILIEGPVIGTRRYAAAFDADDPESLLTVLEKDPTLQIEQRPDVLIVRAR